MLKNILQRADFDSVLADGWSSGGNTLYKRTDKITKIQEKTHM